MPTSITDAVSIQSIARTDPFGSNSMFKDPSAQAAAHVDGMANQISSISSFPGLDGALQGQFSSLTSAMSDYTSGITQSFADRMGSFSKDMSTIAGEIDLYDTSSPCGIIDAAMGTFSKIGDIMSDAMKGMKKLLSPITDAIGDIFDKAHEMTDKLLAKLHSVMDKVSKAINSAIDYMNKKLTEFKDMVAKELKSLGKMLGKLVDLSYLDDLRNLSVCGHNVLDAVMG